MPSPFPGMDPFLEKTPFFHELHTQMLASAQRLLQPQLRPKYIARLERRFRSWAPTAPSSIWGAASAKLMTPQPPTPKPVTTDRRRGRR